MCTTCGCSTNSQHLMTHLKSGGTLSFQSIEAKMPIARIEEQARDTRTIKMEEEILGKNDRIANLNRRKFSDDGILALNFVSSPGAGKTTLLTRTIRDLGTQLSIGVIEGDQETVNDAKRIREAGADVVQINTGTGCHLEAEMISRAFDQLSPAKDSVLFIENVGNLVCPALFDLGEKSKVVILSVTEGEDKPVKYPHMFQAADLLLLSKVDLLPYLDFDIDRCLEYVRAVNPEIRVIQVSATRGHGLEEWYDWIRNAQPIAAAI
jgi:hydrogenase nickel incorporation protein HypB